MATNALWDAFKASLSTEDTAKLTGLLSYLNPDGSPLVSFKDFLGKSIEEVSDILKDYNASGGTNSITSALTEKIMTAIIGADGLSGIDPCAPRENLQNLFYSQFSSNEASEIAAVLNHIIEKKLTIGGAKIESFEGLFNFLKSATNEDKDSFSEDMKTLMGTLPCHHPFNLTIAKNLRESVGFFESSITEHTSVGSQLLDIGNSPLSGVTVKWVSDDGTIVYGESVTDENGNYSLPYSLYNVADSNSQADAKLQFFSATGKLLTSTAGNSLAFPPLPGFEFPDIDPADFPTREEVEEGNYALPTVNEMFNGTAFTLFEPVDSGLKTWLTSNKISSLQDVRSLGDFKGIVMESEGITDPEVIIQIERIQCYAELSLVTEELPLMDFLFDNGIKGLDNLINTPVENLLALEANIPLEDDQFGDYLLAEIAESAAAINEMIDNTTIEWSTENEQ
jgi:hypothetical protein